MTNNINVGNIIANPKTREVIYSVFTVLGVALGATQVGFSAAQQGQPAWLTVALAVYAFLGAAGLGVARANTPTTGHIIDARDTSPTTEVFVVNPSQVTNGN